MIAAILAGGQGSRLRPAYSDGPKCMAPIGGWPFLAYQITWLERKGISGIVICAGYGSKQIREWLRTWDTKIPVQVSEEDKPLGTAGALKHASSLLSDPFLAVNGDTLLDLDLAAMEYQHTQLRVLGTVALKQISERYSINAGVYIFEKAVLDLIPAGVCWSIDGGLLHALAEYIHRPSPLSINWFTAGDFFVDIGTPKEYERAQIVVPRFVA